MRCFSENETEVEGLRVGWINVENVGRRSTQVFYSFLSTTLCQLMFMNVYHCLAAPSTAEVPM